MVICLMWCSTSITFAKESKPDFDIEEATYRSELIYAGTFSRIDKQNKLAKIVPEEYFKGSRLSMTMPVRLSSKQFASSLVLGQKYFVFVPNAVPTEGFFDSVKNEGIIPYSKAVIEQIKDALALSKKLPEYFDQSESVTISRMTLRKGEPYFWPQKFYKGPPISVSLPVHKEFKNPVPGELWILFITDAVPVDGKFPVTAAIPYSEWALDKILEHLDKVKDKAR